MFLEEDFKPWLPTFRHSNPPVHSNSPADRRTSLAPSCKQPKKTDGQEFLERLADLSPNGFTVRFSQISTRLGLGAALNGRELSLLYEAALYAMLCYIAINGLGGCGSEIKPEREPHRMQLERDLMSARRKLCACAGWKGLPDFQKASAEGIFLKVFVTEDNLRP
jgi:hypothetical protein